MSLYCDFHIWRVLQKKKKKYELKKSAYIHLGIYSREFFIHMKFTPPSHLCCTKKTTHLLYIGVFSHWNATSTNAIGGGKCTLENILKVGKNKPVSYKSVMFLKKKILLLITAPSSPRKGQWRLCIIQTVTHLVLLAACQVLSVEIFVRCSCFLNNFLFVILSQFPSI